MKSPPNMPAFGRAPIIGQQQQQMQAQVQAAIGQLSLGIYTQVATAHVGTRDEHQSIEPDRLRRLAKDSQAAARYFFEGIGVIQLDAQEDKP